MSNIVNNEKLHFKIGIAGTYWQKVPKYSIALNDVVLYTKEISGPSGEIEYVEFDYETVEGPCELKIRLLNKDDNDVVKDDDTRSDFKIIKDLLLNIKSIEIDEIDLGDLVWKKGIFTGDDPARPVLDKCVDLGWNGTWTLAFESPFYIWLLENI